MDLTLQRVHFSKRSVCGELVADGLRLHTLELPVKDGLPGSAIPPGRYRITLSPSPKFMSSLDPWVQRYAPRMPHVDGIPRRSLIMIHWGNYPDDTDGCILVGHTHDLDFVGASRAAFDDLYKVIEPSAAAGECWLSVQGGLPETPDSALDEADI